MYCVAFGGKRCYITSSRDNALICLDGFRL